MPGGLWTVSADDHHNDGDDPGDTRVLPDDDRATPLRRAVQRAVWGPPVPAGSDLRRRGGGHVRVRRAARAVRHGQRIHVRSGSLPHRHAVRVAVRAARVRERLRMPLRIWQTLFLGPKPDAAPDIRPNHDLESLIR